MMDRRTLVTTAGAAFAAAVTGTARAAVSPLDYSWQRIAQSRFIVIGTTRPPEGSYPGDAEGPLIEVPVHDVRALKGTPPSPLVLAAANFAPGVLDTQAPWRFAGHPALLFVGDESSTPPLVSLTSIDSIIPAEPEVVAAVSKEVVSQAAYLAAWKPDAQLPHHGQVKATIDWLMALSPTDPGIADKQAYAFGELMALGEGAASAIVAQMNDRRPLPLPHLARRPTPTGQVRRHAPRLVIDALTVMLEELTGQGFGAPYDDGRESQRQLAFDGWRLYVGRHTRGLR
jgi:hypothetical protein